MLHKCANPDCSSLFRRMTEGKLFVVEMDSPRIPLDSLAGKRRKAKHLHRIEYRWLCDDCSRYLTIAFEPGRGTIIVPLRDVTAKKPVSAAVRPVTWAGGRMAAGGERMPS